MAAFFALPLDISLVILGDWIILDDLSSLDSACTSRGFREDFLSILQDRVFKLRMTKYHHIEGKQLTEFVHWLNIRRVKLTTIVLHLNDMAQWTEVDLGLVGSTTELIFEANWDDKERKTLDSVNFRALLIRLPSLTCIDMTDIPMAKENAKYVTILASMKHLKLKRIELDDNSSSMKHLDALVSSFHGTLEWLSLGLGRVVETHLTGPALEMISTACTKLISLKATLSDDSSGTLVLASFACNRLPFLKFLQFESDADMFSDNDIVIGNAELLDICKYHPLLEVLTLPLGKRTTLASCAEALEVCPQLMHISTKGYSFEVRRDGKANSFQREPFVDGQRYCRFEFKATAARTAVLESDFRNIKSLRSFPICYMSCMNVPEDNLRVISEIAGNDLMELQMWRYNRPVDASCFIHIFQHCPFIRIFGCADCDLSDEMLVALANHAHHVQDLSICLCKAPRLEDDVVYLLEKIGSRLRCLNTANTLLLRASLSAIVSHCPNLATLQLNDKGISAQDFMQVLIQPNGLSLLTFLVAQKKGVVELMKCSGIPEDSRWWQLVH